MKIKLGASLALIAGLFAINSPIFAHHGSAAYDNSKPVTLKNLTVTKVNWGNPHTLLLFDTKDDQGNVKHWVAEANAASAVSSSGWTRNAIQPGDTVTVVLYAARNGQPLGRVVKQRHAAPANPPVGWAGGRPGVCGTSLPGRRAVAALAEPFGQPQPRLPLRQRLRHE